MVELLKLYALSRFRVTVPSAPMWAPILGEIIHIGWVCLVLGETKVSGIVVGIEAGFSLPQLWNHAGDQNSD